MRAGRSVLVVVQNRLVDRLAARFLVRQEDEPKDQRHNGERYACEQENTFKIGHSRKGTRARGTASTGATVSEDESVPHSARVWNYWLGGKDDFGADRAAGDRVAAVFPEILDAARHTRAFLCRAVAYLADDKDKHDIGGISDLC